MCVNVGARASACVSMCLFFCVCVCFCVLILTMHSYDHQDSFLDYYDMAMIWGNIKTSPLQA